MTEQLGTIPQWQHETREQHPPLLPEEIHVWFLPLRLTQQQTHTALGMLSDIQRDKYHRRRTEQLKQTYLAGRYFLLNLLAEYTFTPAHKIQLSYTQLNKPYLSSSLSTPESSPEANIQFNFSDTCIDGQRNSDASNNTVGVFVFCKNRSVGVDIESLSRNNNFQAIAESRFSANELDFVTSNNGVIDKRRCLAIWTRKEAYGKAIGQGINFAMNQVDLASPNSFEHTFKDANDLWRLHQLQPRKNLISCIAYAGHQNLDIKAFNSANHIA